MLEECISHKQFKYGWEQVYERMGPALGDKGTAKIAMRLYEIPAQDNDCNDCNDGDDDDDESGGWRRLEEKLKKTSDKHIITPAIKEVKQEDPEVREARSSGANHASSLSPAPTPSSVTVNVAGTSSLTVFLHNILTVAINSPEKSSRFLKTFRMYSAMRSDPLNQYLAQLRDPFVMKCTNKVIYDTVMAISRAQKQRQHQDEKQEYQGYARSRLLYLSDPELSATGATKLQAMMIGPLIDLAF
ncbi:hypothetical protein BGX21_008745 [Mortierella sp. AD011]|nr:hypothetical protein BGX21_008745 [Mortierella sp. AD011]